MKRTAATIVREYGPFPGVARVNGVSYDGAHVWIATGDTLNAIRSGERQDGAQARRRRACGNRLRRPAPLPDRRRPHPDGRPRDRPRDRDHPDARRRRLGNGVGGRDAVGRATSRRKIHQVDPETGAILRTLESNRFVTGVTWVDGELWHATWEGDESELRRIDPQSGEVLTQLDMPAWRRRLGPRVGRRRHVLLRRRK